MESYKCISNFRDIEIREEILYDYGVDGLSFEKEKVTIIIKDFSNFYSSPGPKHKEHKSLLYVPVSFRHPCQWIFR